MHGDQFITFGINLLRNRRQRHLEMLDSPDSLTFQIAKSFDLFVEFFTFYLSNLSQPFCLSWLLHSFLVGIVRILLK